MLASLFLIFCFILTKILIDGTTPGGRRDFSLTQGAYILVEWFVFEFWRRHSLLNTRGSLMCLQSLNLFRS